MKFLYFVLLFFPVIVSTQELMPIRPPPYDDVVEEERIIPKSKFTVVAPYDIRQGLDYNIHFRGFSLSKAIKFTITINGTRDGGKILNIKKTVTISRDNSKASLTIDTSDISSGNYALYVEGGDFAERRTLTYITKKYSFLIFMNKPIYAPNDNIQYKIFSINSETKSVDPKCASIISISDENGNVVTSSPNVSFTKGKYANEFQLSAKASLGLWRLQIQCDDEMMSKEFQVAEYTLPLIEGKLIIQETTPFSFGKVSITVDVSYTVGGEASGNATVTVQKYEQDIYKRDVMVSSGSATFDVDIVNHLKVQPMNYDYFTASLVFNDALTGIKVSDTKSFSITPYLYNIYTTSDSNIKPGLPFTFNVTLKKYDGSPAPAGIQIQVIPENPNTIPNQTLTTDADGSASSSVNVPKEAQYVSIRFTTKNSYDGYVGASVPYTNTGSFLSISTLTEKPKIFQPIDLLITSGELTDYIILHIVSKGILLKSTKIWFDQDYNEDNDLKTVTYSFTPSLKYIPNTQVIAYYINDNGDFVVGQAYIMFENQFGNYLKITPSQSEVKPAAEVEFQIESYTYSTVSLAAMDQRLLLLASGNNVTKQNVYDGLAPYTYNNVNYDWNNVDNYEYSFGGAGLFVFTNIPRHVRRYYFVMPAFAEDAAQVKRKEGASTSKGDTKIREDFRETFLWTDINIQNSLDKNAEGDDYFKGLETISEKVPQSITKYLIYGVSMSKYDGIGLSDDVPSVTISLPFFLSVELPFSVKRNEVLLQDIYIFNTLKRGQKVVIQITKDSKFVAVDLSKYGWQDSNGKYNQTITTQAGKNVKLQFALRPKSLGFISIEVTAKGPLAGDGIKKQLRVIPEGIPRSITKSAFIGIDSSTSSDNINVTLQCNLPKSAYQDTTEISATVAGDIFGKALNNLDNLIHMPGGCGEQTMLSLAPNIAVFQYLSASNKLTPTLKATLEKYIAFGYQNELGYQRTDGSFSAFGNSDTFGSTWLSAYVGIYFYFSKTIVPIDSNTIKKTADFVASQQQGDGSFKEPGRVIHVDMQGGSGNGIALTAYCTIFFLTILPDFPEYLSVKNNALSYLESSFNATSTTYELGIIANALNLGGSSKATNAYTLFNARKIEQTLDMYWSMPVPPNPGYWYYNQARSLDIETTSYGLILHIARGSNLKTLIKIVRYLVSKANSFGGYQSSQDTVMGLYSLSKFAVLYSLNANVNITMKPNVGSAISATVDPSNAFTLQSFELNPGAREMKVEVDPSSTGLAIVSLICNFYEDPTKVIPVFNVTSKPGYSCNSRITFDACAKYIPKGSSNMAIMIVVMPSGFVYSEWYGNSNPNISKTEVTNQGSKVTFYFNSISNDESCVTVNAYRAKFVAELKGGVIQVFDYYDTSKEGSNSYSIPDLSKPCYYYMVK